MSGRQEGDDGREVARTFLLAGSARPWFRRLLHPGASETILGMALPGMVSEAPLKPLTRVVGISRIGQVCVCVCVCVCW